MIPKILLIIFLSLLLIPLVNAEEISLQYPSSVNFGESFTTTIELINFSEKIYDVKIDILNTNGDRISRIENNGEWKSTFYYVSEVMNTSITNSSDFSLNITSEYNGTAEIKVTLREGSNTYSFDQYNLTIIKSVEEVIEQNISINDCSSVDVVEIEDYPESIKFGEVGEFEINFDASCYDFNSTKILVYGDSSRVVSDENDTKIKTYSSCEGGELFGELSNKTYNFDISFNTYSNCDERYSEKNHTISLRVCEPSWNKYYEETFSVDFTGTNSSNCEGYVEETEEEVKEVETEEVEEIVKQDETVKVQTPQKTTIKKPIKEEVIYESKDSEVKKIAVYLLIFLFLLLIIYVLLNKGKV